MSDPIISAPATVCPGEIQFYDRIAPPFKAGSHVLGVTQTVTGIVGDTDKPFSTTQPFEVAAPRFRINPATIQQVFPPANTAGSYHGALPSMVFKEFSLPWMRTVDPTAKTDDPRPWIGLLTIAQSEMPVPPGKSGPADPKLTFPATMDMTELVTPKQADVLPPKLGTILPSEGDKVVTVDMDLNFFTAIAPTAEDLLFLAHARVVNTDGKVILGMDEDGAFSVVTGNRIAQDGGDNTVLLVSYEGHQDHLPGGPPIDSSFKKIRLVVLGSWSFHANTTPGGFLQLMEELCTEGRGGVDLLRLPATASGDAWAQEALAIGYVPLQNDLRDGEVATALYRGPLVPEPTQTSDSYGPYYFSDHAIHYDPEYGIFNHAYACAWQVGRLLALSDGAFVQSLVDWRRDYAKRASDATNALTVRAPLSAALTAGNTIEADAPSAMRHVFSDRFAELADAIPQMRPRARVAAPGSMLPVSETTTDALADPLAQLRRFVAPTDPDEETGP
ncbi:hypothetical protein A8B78_11800 [Jannaschia sp. EhC01]|nr:hypothetical protein A8B78_11800 [Jannaschia sp. EhC01]